MGSGKGKARRAQGSTSAGTEENNDQGGLGVRAPAELFSEQLVAAVQSLGEEYVEGFKPLVQRSKNDVYGDYQTNGLFALAKRSGEDQMTLAEKIAALLPQEDWAEIVVSRPGFINVRCRDAALSQLADSLRSDARLGLRPASKPQRVVVDYSAPNVAKQLHVGHLRSTVIGDSLVRVLEACGHTVEKRNHLGDWVTPMGIVCQWLKEEGIDPATSTADSSKWYAQAKAVYDTDAEFAARAQERVVALQRGDVESVALWRAVREKSLLHLDET